MLFAVFDTLFFLTLLPIVCRGENNYLLGKLSSIQLPQLPNLPHLSTMTGFPNSLQQISSNDIEATEEEEERVPCSCGVFLNGQLGKKPKEQPRGNAALLQELTETFQCNSIGERQCINKCLESIMRFLPNSPMMVCGSIDRDCFKERAYLFVKNCRNTWIPSNLSAGREYCCKDGMPYKCPPS